MDKLIATTEICTCHAVEYTFIDELGQAGLLELKIIDQAAYIPDYELQKLEKMIRMHYELEINIAGIEAISHLLERVEKMQEDIRLLRNQTRLHR